eukprot:TRINITY_DN2205_c0_g1_i1.p1 TRINITY_DN2205_c0_g1~~TRINITY_DN2205_c0_g1_i1.p1  ORF type:complete len:200 (-),score=29.39 TRINITY_DN2205_c0_g1_i1:672-1271(-)
MCIRDRIRRELNWEMILFIFVLVLGQLTFAERNYCPAPPPASSYSNEGYMGDWYEVGKIQTWGGAIFEAGCVCTKIHIGKGQVDGGLTATQGCNYFRPKWLPASTTAALTPLKEPQPGRFTQRMFGRDVNYVVVHLEKDFAIQFDCDQSSLATNYCVHVLSRTPVVDESKIRSFFAFAEGLGLNPKGLSGTITKQKGCA